MLLTSLSILNYKNIREANLTFSPKVNCLVGLNGQGKTNILDAIYLLSFTKSAFSVLDSQNITHGQDFAMVQGEYQSPCLTSNSASDPTSNSASGLTSITCGIKRGTKKTFKWGSKAYTRLLDHIGRIPLVMVCPQDQDLLTDGSDERRRFMDSVISQQDRTYLEHLTCYNTLLKQRNTLLKQLADEPAANNSTAANTDALLEVYEMQMLAPAQYIYRARTRFVEHFVPIFSEIYREISGGSEEVSLRYISQLQDRDLAEAWARTHSRDIILGWTSQGIHKDDIEMCLETYPIKQVGSQGQQKTFVLAMKLAQALYLSSSASDPTSSSASGLTANSASGLTAPILLLDDIFDKLDNERVERIIRLVNSDRFGQIFITDTDRQHLTDILGDLPDARVFIVSDGQIA